MTEDDQSNKVYINFIAQGKNEDQWLVVLVEEAGLDFDIDDFLYEFQDRLYNCLDAIIDGQLAKEFPDTVNKDIVIRVDCYKLPEEDVKNFFKSFTEGVLSIPDYNVAIQESNFVNELSFEINFE